MNKLLSLAAVVASAGYMVDAADAYNGAKVGDWTPPNPPAKEITHLSHLNLKPGEKLPAPSVLTPMEEEAETSFLEVSASEAAAGGALRVPHNWFGTGKFNAPKYAIATGKEECDVCKHMISSKRSEGTVDFASGGEAAAGAEAAAGVPPGYGCDTINKIFTDTCNGYASYIDQCPSFVHNICHEDMGGSERLRSPCPEHLICYYCLRINPLYCVE